MNRQSTVRIQEDETLENLQLGGYRLIQKKQGFRFGMDSVLLADFAKARGRDHVVDFGCGTGILPILMIGRGKGDRYTGIEIQPQMAEMARRSMLLNGLEDRVTILEADIAGVTEYIPPCSVDVIVCNPPYGMPGMAMRNQDIGLATARHQEKHTLAAFLKAGFQILKGKGRMFLVYPAPQMFSLMTEIKKQHLEPKHFRLVYPEMHKPANLVLVEAVKDARPRLHPMPPLIINTENGDLTNELKSIYHITE